MTQINPTLLELAQHRVWKDAGLSKAAAVPPGGGAPAMDPAMMGGAMPAGGMPPMDPAMGGGAPPMDPAMMGGAPPMDPAMMGGAAGGAAGGMPPPADPMAAAAGPAAAPMKLKPEQMMQMLDFRLYNMQQQLTAIMNAMSIQLPPGALVTPPGSPTPVAEAAVPGGPQDPGPSESGGGGGGTSGSAINPIDAIQGASPELAGAGKQASQGAVFAALLDSMAARQSQQKTSAQILQSHSPADNAVAVQHLLRAREAARQAR